MKSYKVGTIGYGGSYNMGKHHLTMMMNAGKFVPVAVCDSDPSRLKIAREEIPGIETYASVKELLKKSSVELLVVILPHHLHAGITLECLKAGRHVVVEKPFALTVKDCDRMINEADKRNLMVTAYHNRHWDSIAIALRKHLKKIGRPYRWESFSGGYARPTRIWRNEKASSGGVIYDWGAHYMENMLDSMRYRIKEISGFSINEVWPNTNEDELEVTVKFYDDAIASHTHSTVLPVGNDTIRVMGTKGALVSTDRNDLYYYKPNKKGEIKKIEIPLEATLYDKFYKNVYAHLSRGTELIITPEWARRVVQVLEYGHRSALLGKSLSPKYE